MSTTSSIEVPPPDVIRAQLAAAVAEARALRQLLRLSETARKVAEARQLRQQPPSTKGGKHVG